MRYEAQHTPILSFGAGDARDQFLSKIIVSAPSQRLTEAMV